VNNSQSGFSKGVCFKSGQLEYTCSITCKQSCSSSNCLSPWEISKPRYSTVVCTIWAFFCDTLYPASPMKFNRSMVALLHSCSEVVLINILFTYCHKATEGCLPCQSSNSLASTLLNKVGLFLNPWGSTVQQSWTFPFEREQFLAFFFQRYTKESTLQVLYCKINIILRYL